MKANVVESNAPQNQDGILNDTYSRIDQKKLKLTETLKRYIYGIKLQ
jgi:hypothetical protein